MGIRLESIVVLTALALTGSLSSNPATACEACVDNRCTPALYQGADGCAEGELPCSLLQKLTVGCDAWWCSTAEYAPCGKRRPAGPQPVEPIRASSTGASQLKPATPVLQEVFVAEALTCGTAFDPPFAAQHD